MDPFRFYTPCSILVVGSSGCGKTVFVDNLLQQLEDHFDNPVRKVLYCHGVWQDRFDSMKKRGVAFHEGLPPDDLGSLFPPSKRPGLLILDDLMSDAGNDRKVLDLFTKESHHKNIAVIYICQDMFPSGKYAKTISRNAHYIIAFKNPRDQLGVRNLVQQSFPHEVRKVMEAFRDATARDYGYMLFDLHPRTQDDVRLKTCILHHEGPTVVFQRKESV